MKRYLILLTMLAGCSTTTIQTIQVVQPLSTTYYSALTGYGGVNSLINMSIPFATALISPTKEIIEEDKPKHSKKYRHKKQNNY